VGAPAPDFTLTDAHGAPRHLSEFHGTYVVLEWFNPECPFVRKHYGTGNMQALQQEMTREGVTWLAIDSSAPGNQGHLLAEQARAFIDREGVAATAVLLDPHGEVGRQYGAKTTPHMFVVNPEGVLIYAGAIDDRPTPDPADVPGATNYVRQALREAQRGQPISVPQTKSYGCSVKY
jgi:peroxiredoxin